MSTNEAGSLPENARPPSTAVKKFIILFTLLATLTARAAERPPNIIFVLADDLGWGEIGCQGQRLIATPNIDRMAREGMRFPQFYAGNTVCGPSRCTLLTGRHNGHAQIRGNVGAKLPGAILQPEDTTVAEVLKRAGYATACIGKWGLGTAGSTGVPTKKGFDYFLGYLDHVHAHNPYTEFLYRGEERMWLKNKQFRDGKADADNGAGVAEWKGEYVPDLLTAEALQWVGQNKERPFFLYWSLITPHANNEATRRTGNGGEVPDLGDYKERDWTEQAKAHAAIISRLDADLGRMLGLLKESGLDENTLVIFTSDNGHHNEAGHDPAFFNEGGPLRGFKRAMYEGGIRIPFIARWPGKVRAGAEAAHVGYFGDFLATAADLAHTEAPANLDSISFAPTLLGHDAEQKKHDFLYWEFHERGFSQAALLDGHWKAVRNLRHDAPLELYDLAGDLGETKDTAGEHPDIVAKLEEYLRNARTEAPDYPIKDAAK